MENNSQNSNEVSPSITSDVSDSINNQTLPSPSNPTVIVNTNNEAEKMKIYGVSNCPPQTRHARRIYVGGVPPNYFDEDSLRNFLNHVIAIGLGEDNDESYVISVYINQKKCFAFVEIKDIELTTACLDLDGIIYKKVVLKILRANEYKPELVPPSLSKPIKLNLSSFSFGSSPTINSTNIPFDGEKNHHSGFMGIDSIIKISNLNNLERGSIVLLGYPFDENHKRVTLRGIGCTAAPKVLRNSIKKFNYGSIFNPEFEIDISNLSLVDVGDVLSGKTPEDTKDNLAATVYEIISRGNVPFVIGGSNDQTYYSTVGAMRALGNRLGSLTISAQLDSQLIENKSFLEPNYSYPFCDGRFIRFAAQGSQCCKETSQFILEAGGQIVWLTRDLRSLGSKFSPVEKFKASLVSLSNRSPNGDSIPIVVSLDAGALCSNFTPYSNSNNSPIGLSIVEALEMTKLAGACPNVVLFELTEFSPGSEDSRSNLLLAEIYYNFLTGVAMRNTNPKTKEEVISFNKNSFKQFSMVSEATGKVPIPCPIDLSFQDANKIRLTQSSDSYTSSESLCSPNNFLSNNQFSGTPTNSFNIINSHNIKSIPKKSPSGLNSSLYSNANSALHSRSNDFESIKQNAGFFKLNSHSDSISSNLTNLSSMSINSMVSNENVISLKKYPTSLSSCSHPTPRSLKSIHSNLSIVSDVHSFDDLYDVDYFPGPIQSSQYDLTKLTETDHQPNRTYHL